MVDDPRKLRAANEFRKLQRAEDGKKAMSEYQAETAAVQKRAEQLRAARLARDAAAKAAAPVAPAAAPKRGKTAKPAPAKLADWLKDQNDSGRNN